MAGPRMSLAARCPAADRGLQGGFFWGAGGGAMSASPPRKPRDSRMALPDGGFIGQSGTQTQHFGGWRGCHRAEKLISIINKID